MFSYTINADLKLQILQINHADDIYAAIKKNREYLGEFLPWALTTASVDEVKLYIEYELKRFTGNNGVSCGIFYQDRYIGNISVHDINWKHRKTSIGYWLSAEHQGKGFMTEACRKMIAYIFQELELNRIEIRVRVDNARSKAIPLRLGFVQEGIIREAEYNKGEYHDHLVYGLLKSEWKPSIT
ncbi:GNAT family N-acetyltransferase [Paenibacillus lignilyticus]|uniref:GNAT family N-acetyltransferase n=1 Tax=Paenibacillus lignilyticus TaxID=1172615 RepID=A0ABS5C778_9BACL|nr:GNAT family protein [Paenibacillus lignilyticus]MBP3961758.1 GNAT family N-acetyltransferase [Paenibacillus lignilyticus]MBP3963571.1 GNAT family N-acetyltransferase [Paenibacillus lignilyticus]